nr:immunoglobulin heavy chain junction region [Mus musculus]MBK4186372.1 immunoglobulin heavy chain junction region [Mus musculus]MBK4186373.1 immunoglobulin heavy chain junction region [Mus musculus]
CARDYDYALDYW